jgi:hypothetical protein
MDYHFFRDIESGSQQKLFQVLGIDSIADKVPTDLNVSSKDVPLPDDAGVALMPFLAKEYQLIDKLTRLRDDA